MAKPVNEWARADLEALIGQEEGSGLEFKASPALLNTQPNKAELVKDVTAMANAAGGTIIYGLVENGAGVAERLDEGVEQTPEWIEQVLTSNAEPKVADVVIQRIAAAEGRWHYVIDVPQATSRAPHQSKIEHRYYRRWGTTVQKMFDHEVRDVMRRASAPELYFDYLFSQTGEDRFDLRVIIGNRSSEPALYGITTLTFDEQLLLADVKSASGEFKTREAMISAYGGDHPAMAYVRNFNLPGDLPIFQEQVWLWLSASIEIKRATQYPIQHRIACPGFAGTRTGSISRRDNGEPRVYFFED